MTVTRLWSSMHQDVHILGCSCESGAQHGQQQHLPATSQHTSQHTPATCTPPHMSSMYCRTSITKRHAPFTVLCTCALYSQQGAHLRQVRVCVQVGQGVLTAGEGGEEARFIKQSRHAQVVGVAGGAVHAVHDLWWHEVMCRCEVHAENEDAGLSNRVYSKRPTFPPHHPFYCAAHMLILTTWDMSTATGS